MRVGGRDCAYLGVSGGRGLNTTKFFSKFRLFKNPKSGIRPFCMPQRILQQDLGFVIVAYIGYLKFQEFGNHQKNFTPTPHRELKPKKKRKKEMSVTVSTDLSVTTAPCRVEEKMNDKRNALLESLRKGEPKIFGVSELHFV